MSVNVYHHHHHISRSQQRKYGAWINSKSMVPLVGHMSTGATVDEQDVSRIATREQDAAKEKERREVILRLGASNVGRFGSAPQLLHSNLTS
jgi:hypothetical protein